MSITYFNAWNSEIKQTLEPVEAHKFSLQGKLHHATAFQCSETCPFALTLVNFGKTNYTKTPYYRAGKLDQKHSTNCPLMAHHYNQRAKETTTEKTSTFTRDKSNIIVDIDLIKGILPKASPAQQVAPLLSSNSSQHVKKTSPTHSNTNQKNFIPHLGSLKKLIQYYIAYRYGERYTFLDKHNHPINLDDYFTNLAMFPQLQLDQVSIYYDKATVIDKKEYFLIRLNTVCQSGIANSQPTFLINKDQANHRGVKYKLDILERAAKNKESFTIFYLGTFKTKDDKYINPDMEQSQILDYIVLS